MGLFDGFKQMGKMMAGGGMDAASITQSWDNALTELGLSVTHSEPTPPEGVKMLQNGDETHVTGTLNGVQTEWRFVSYTYMESNWSNQYSWVNDRRMHFAIPNVGDWTVTLMPKTKGLEGGMQTSVQSFNEAFHVTTNDEARFNEVFTQDILQDFADRGWMHLEIAGDWLTVIDDFQNQFATSATGGMKAMSATHPLFGSSVSSMAPNMDVTRRFLDVITTLAKQVK